MISSHHIAVLRVPTWYLGKLKRSKPCPWNHPSVHSAGKQGHLLHSTTNLYSSSKSSPPSSFYPPLSSFAALVHESARRLLSLSNHIRASLVIVFDITLTHALVWLRDFPPQSHLSQPFLTRDYHINYTSLPPLAAPKKLKLTELGHPERGQLCQRS